MVAAAGTAADMAGFAAGLDRIALLRAVGQVPVVADPGSLAVVEVAAD